MPNIASVLKAEIARVARKEVRAQTEPLKKSTTNHRAEIAALKRRLKELEQALRQARRAGPKAKAGREAEADDAAGDHRFSAKGFGSHRRRLGLSAADVGLLLGTSGQTIYHWETGKARPRAGALAGIVALRAMGKREALARLESLKPAR
jgi:DNA-binding transcriptional regulator YiaG